MNQKKLVNGIVIISIAIIVSGIVYSVIRKRMVLLPTPIACTQEAKRCPDGSYVSRTGPNCEFAECSQKIVFENLLTFTIGDQVRFGDSLILTLMEINDSRCKPEVVCVWEGELSPVFRITEEGADKLPKEIRLGTVTATSVTESGYVFILKEATTTTATIAVTNEKEAHFRERDDNKQ